MNNSVKEIRNIDIVNLVVFLLGIIFSLTGVIGNDFWMQKKSLDIKTAFLSIGCSLIATSIVTYFTSRYQIRKERIKSIIEIWGLDKIYDTRAEMNHDCDISQSNAKQHIDIVGFGLSSWRQSCTDTLKEKLRAGVDIRILVPRPDTDIIKQRERDEDNIEGNISMNIHLLSEWVTELSQFGKIKIKFYDALPLDFYFRIDDDLYIGPYLYKKQSQQTISFKYVKPGKMFSYYTSYFENIWNSIT